MKKAYIQHSGIISLRGRSLTTFTRQGRQVVQKCQLFVNGYTIENINAGGQVVKKSQNLVNAVCEGPLMKSVPLFQIFAHFPQLGKLELSKGYTTVSLARWRMDIAFVRFASRTVIKATILYFLKRMQKATATVASKALEA